MPRLLIVDDEKSLCQMLEIAFRKGGFSVETVSSGALAQRKMNSQHYDVVVSDIRMPDLTGIELLEYAKKIGQPAAFILITAVPTMSTAIEALNLGAYRYVIKTDKLVEELKFEVGRALEDLALRGHEAPRFVISHGRLMEPEDFSSTDPAPGGGGRCGADGNG